MNGRERVQAAIARQPVDKVPLGFYAVDYDTVQRVIGHTTYVRNKVESQLALWFGRRAELAQSLKEDTVDFYRRIDCADLLLPKEAALLPPADYAPDPPRQIDANRYEDRAGRIYQVSREANEINVVYDPNRGKHEYTVAEFDEPVEFTPPDESVFEVWDYVNAQLGQERYVASPTGGIVGITLLEDMTTGLMLYASNPEVVVAANRRIVVQQSLRDPYYIRKGAPGVLVEDDMAGTSGPFISPRAFRDYCLPFLTQRVQQIKQRVPQVILHNCGNNLALMDMLAGTGVDCYQSLQTTAGMEVGLLKERWGDRLAFWGGVPVELLIGGTPDEVRQAVRTALERGAPGGGFILGPSHSVAANTKYENFMALLDEFVRLRDRY